MFPVNLISVLIANKGLPTANRDDLYTSWGIKPKEKELTSLSAFVRQLRTQAPYQPELIVKLMDKCYFGFSIPRIAKEFDCLWIGDNTIVNIELKSEDVGPDRIKKQLIQNNYYLNHLKRQIVSYTYVSSTQLCYSLDAGHNLITVDFKDITLSIYNIHYETLYEERIEDIFPPERFLVSPFNSTEEFLKGFYFLTEQQQSFKNSIVQFANNPAVYGFCALTGGPGSGKTLLAYDIARELMKEGQSVVIGHSGGLNKGHTLLNQNGWNIKSTKDIVVWDTDVKTNTILIKDIVDADFYIIDEAQRCYNLEFIADKIKKKGKKCLISYDSEQIMRDNEQKMNNAAKISAMAAGQLFKLSSNIRTNTAVYEFVNALFDRHHSVNKSVKGKVLISYCQNTVEATLILNQLKLSGYHVPKFTPKLHGTEEYESWFPSGVLSAHEVIGQEFDDVAGLLSERMYYDVGGKLVSGNSYYYREDKMLYQILSRARKRIHLVIVNNPTLLDRCLKMVNKF